MSLQMEILQSNISIDPSFLRMKRLLDIFLLLILSPFIIIVSIVVAVLIRLDSKGPIIFRQKRVGLNGAEFYMLKFRTMYDNCDETIHREATKKYMSGYMLNESPVAPYKLINDTRVTKIGKFLRKMSLDELPQFWNVLRGEMTLVGPRPPLPYEVELYNSYHWLRLSGKPGVTGLWQVYGRNQVTFQEMVEMDITYLQQQSIAEDIKLLTRTIPRLLQGYGV